MKYFIKTFGCAANVADSERIAAYYEARGYTKAESMADADDVVINTCTVRQSAENRVYGLVNNLQKLKFKNSCLAGRQAKFKIQNSNAVVVGRSNIVGKPLALALINLGATVTVCHSETRNLSDFTKKAEILISATGVPGLIKKEMVKPGAVVIDVGSPKGDVDFDEVKKVASFITPVPGGVGPLTVVSLFENLLLDKG